MNIKNFFLISLAVALGVGSIEIFKASARSQEHRQYCYKIADKILESKAISTDEMSPISILEGGKKRRALYTELEEECKQQETEIIRYLDEHEKKLKSRQ